ncbi:hypothetical protein DIPPA_28524 [Diplonema papillatum]|nr:hypothetical protein DIPPA_28524 [Diplonema papillatum]
MTLLLTAGFAAWLSSLPAIQRVFDEAGPREELSVLVRFTAEWCTVCNSTAGHWQDTVDAVDRWGADDMGVGAGPRRVAACEVVLTERYREGTWGVAALPSLGVFEAGPDGSLRYEPMPAALGVSAQGAKEWVRPRHGPLVYGGTWFAEEMEKTPDVRSLHGPWLFGRFGTTAGNTREGFLAVCRGAQYLASCVEVAAGRGRAALQDLAPECAAVDDDTFVVLVPDPAAQPVRCEAMDLELLGKAVAGERQLSEAEQDAEAASCAGGRSGCAWGGLAREKGKRGSPMPGVDQLPSIGADGQQHRHRSGRPSAPTTLDRFSQRWVLSRVLPCPGQHGDGAHFASRFLSHPWGKLVVFVDSDELPDDWSEALRRLCLAEGRTFTAAYVPSRMATVVKHFGMHAAVKPAVLYVTPGNADSPETVHVVEAADALLNVGSDTPEGVSAHCAGRSAAGFSEAVGDAASALCEKLYSFASVSALGREEGPHRRVLTAEPPASLGGITVPLEDGYKQYSSVVKATRASVASVISEDVDTAVLLLVHAPWSRYAKALRPMFEACAVVYHKRVRVACPETKQDDKCACRVRFAEYDAEANEAAFFNSFFPPFVDLKSYPTVLLFPSARKENGSFRAVPYLGPHSSFDIWTFVAAYENCTGLDVSAYLSRSVATTHNGVLYQLSAMLNRVVLTVGDTDITCIGLLVLGTSGLPTLAFLLSMIAAFLKESFRAAFFRRKTDRLMADGSIPAGVVADLRSAHPGREDIVHREAVRFLEKKHR